MASFVAPASSTVRKNLTPGVFLARCYSMVDLGTQTDTYLGEEKVSRKIRLTWEFPTEKDTFSPEKGEEPYVLGSEFTFSMHEKATFRKTLESWRGRRFTDDEARAFDAGKLLGAPCTINVVAYQKKDGSDGVKIGSISPMMKGQECPAQINPTQAFSLSAIDGIDQTMLDSLPPFVRDKIKLSPEYQASTGNGPAPATQISDPVMPTGQDVEGDDLPF